MKEIKYNKISTYFYLNKRSFIFASVSGVLYNLLMVFVPYVQGKLIDCFQLQEDTDYIVKLAVFFLGFVIFIQVNRYIKRYFVRDFANKMVLQMRRVSFDNLLNSDIEEISSSARGDIMNRNLSDIKDSAEGVRKALTEVYDTLILMGGYFISMMILDYKITLITTLFIVLSVSLATLLKKKVYKATASYKKTFSSFKDVTLSSVGNETYYRGMGVSSNYYKNFSDKIDELEKKSVRSMILKGSLEPFYQALALTGLFFVIYFGGKKVIDNVWMIGTFSAYLTTYMLVARKASKMGKLINAVTAFRVSWKRCLPYLKNPKEKKEIVTGKNEMLVVKDLSFGFDESFMIKNISFSLKKGESLGICGSVHSGKSTLGAALSGVYKYEGSVRLYDVELKDVREDVKEGFIAYCPSGNEIFNDTLEYNVGFGKKEIDQALKDACMEEDIVLMKNGRKEILSHSSSNLSGGQQKRLMIARCLSGEAKLVILDEPFKAVDLEMSEKILNNILSRYNDSIFVLINNQKEIMEKMDKIIFLKKDGYLFGTFEELSSDEEFAHLFGGKKK